MQQAQRQKQNTQGANKRNNDNNNRRGKQNEGRVARPTAPSKQVLMAAPDALPLTQNSQQVAASAAKIDALVLEKLSEAKQQPNATS